MKFFGVNYGHDAGCAVFEEDGSLSFYAECERYSRIKTHSANIDPIINAFPNLRPSENDVVVLLSLLEKDLPTVSDYDSKYIRTVPKLKFLGTEISKNYIIDHHLGHTFSSWCFRKDDKERLFLSYDGQGANTNGDFKSSIVGIINENSFFVIDDAVKIPTSSTVAHFLGNNTPGKLMGLAGYIDEVPEFEWNHYNFEKLSRLSYFTTGRDVISGYPRFADPSNLTESDMRFAASYYNYVTEMIFQAVAENIKRYSDNRGVVISGGSTLALDVNTRIYDLAGDVVFGPPTNDSGLALGAAAFAYYTHFKKWPKVKTPSLMELPSPLEEVGPQKPAEIAKLIETGHVVALVRGKAEAGPRALGYRSLLASAKNPDNLKRVSEEIKNREFYRPLAPIVTAESFDNLFVGPKGEYMQYKVQCTEICQKYLPAIVHRDRSARPQVVYKENDPWLHELLTEYGKYSGFECMINTSLNTKSKPICNTLDDVREDMEGKDVTIVCVP